MDVFEFKDMLIEIVVLYPASDDYPVTLECTDLRSEMLFEMFRDNSGEIVLHPLSERIPLDLIAHVTSIAQKRL